MERGVLVFERYCLLSEAERSGRAVVPDGRAARDPIVRFDSQLLGMTCSLTSR